MCAASSPRGLMLIAIPRPSERDRGNLFVRLAPRTARKLAASLLYPPQPSSRGDDRGGDTADASSSREIIYNVDDVDFLPLEIVILPKGVTSFDGMGDGRDGCIVLYASYNGGSPSAVGPINNSGIIELPLDLHPSLHAVFNTTSEPVLASVRALSDVPVAERVTFEPLTVSDWEMIEMESTILEDGGLLNQITVVSPDQVLPLRFGGRLGTLESAAWIKVVDEGFVTSSNRNLDTHISDECDASLPTDSECDSSTDLSADWDDDDPTRTASTHWHQCVRLMAETEVVIIPKPRSRKVEPIEDKQPICSSFSEPIFRPSSALRVQPISSDIFHAASSEDESFSLPNPSLGFVAVHPTTLIQLPGYQHCMVQCSPNYKINRTDADLPPMVVTIRRLRGPHAKYSQHYEAKRDRTASNVVVAIVYASDCTPCGHIGMNSLLRCQLGVTPLSDWVSVQIWSESNVVKSISGVRASNTRIEIIKVSKASPRDRHSSLHPWNIPDGFSTMTSSYILGNTTLDNTNVPSRATKEIDPVFSSGSLLPGFFLRGLGLDWLDRGADLFVLKLHSVVAPVDDSFDRTECPLISFSRLVPIITVKDLKESAAYDTRLGNDDVVKPISLLEKNNYSFMVPVSEESTVGFTSAIHSLVESSRHMIYHPTIANALMITGEEGSGKTHLSMTSASRLCISDLFATVYLDCKKLQASSANIQFILEEIQKSFQEALHKQPTVFVLDDLDAIIPNVEFSSESEGSIHHHQLNPTLMVQVKVIVDHLLLQSRHCSKSFGNANSSLKNGVVLICTCRDKGSLSSRYQEAGLFHSIVEVPSLDSSQRAQFLASKIFRNMSRSKVAIPHAISRLGKDTDGFRPKDLQIVAARIVHQNYLRSFHGRPSERSCTKESRNEEDLYSLEMLETDIASILDDYSPLSQQLVDIDHNSCSMDWTSIGGLYKARQSLHDIIIHPMKFKLVYDNAPMALPTGILLYGPPGSGKSFIVPLLAKKAKLTLITCRGPELLDRYIGASEAKVRQLFARATASAPSMIFFDEFDSLAPQRGSDHTGVTDRVVNQLLTLLDGAERSKKSSNVYVIAATSRPDKIDKALLRPGRLEKHVYVGYPQTPSEWNSLFSSLLLDTRNVDEEVSCIRQGGNCYDIFCQECDYARDFSAADMKAVLDTARLLCVHEILDANNGGAHAPAMLRKCHILEAFRRTRPSLLPNDSQALQSMYATFGDHQVREDHHGKNDRGLKTSLR
ncbi:hypothetical protein ACHAXA_002020 [Cyclostephanos tholiformis]|uniref:Peroxisomal ATPase PEX1 n=1 Tax=Cyclostephanos tholiformis TaxID=382380 RepID=A0ABD3STE9_9STRA